MSTSVNQSVIRCPPFFPTFEIMEHKFSASLNTTSWVIAAMVIGFTVVMTIFLLNNIEQSHAPGWFVWAFPLFMGSLCLGLLLYCPTGYALTPYSFVIHRPLKDLVIDLDQIDYIRPVSNEEMGLPIRTFGNGGLFGFTGSYFSDRLGRMKWYATRTNHYVLVQLKGGKKIIVTPDEPRELVNQWQAAGGTLPNPISRG